MTIAKASALTAAMFTAMGIGVWTGQQIARRATVMAPAPAHASPVETAPARDSRPAVAPRRAASPMFASVRVDSPALHAKLQPLLNQGADMSIASEGFRSAEQFAAVAHAARNLGVPFMVLKHRIVNDRVPLAKAIHTVAPAVNAPIEADRADAEARSDLAALAM
jgi:hypothetical protein